MRRKRQRSGAFLFVCISGPDAAQRCIQTLFGALGTMTATAGYPQAMTQVTHSARSLLYGLFNMLFCYCVAYAHVHVSITFSEAGVVSKMAYKESAGIFIQL